MANELRLRHSLTGLTDLRATLTNAAGLKWNGTAFEAYVVANWSSYLRTLTETPAGGYLYLGDFPTAITTAGEYSIEFYRGLLISSPRAGAGPVYWDGDSEISVAEWTALLVRQALSTVPAVAAMEAGMITLYRGDTMAASLTGLGTLTGRTKLWFTAKRLTDLADTLAVLQIEETTGLVYLLGEAAATPAQGDIVVTDAAAGAARIDLAATPSATLEPDDYLYDVQMLSASGVRTCGAGVLRVLPDISRVVA